MRRRTWIGLTIPAVLCGLAVTQLPGVAAGGLLQPYRRLDIGVAPVGCVDERFETGETALSGWVCRTGTPRRGTIVYLHGVADNRSGSAGVIGRYLPRGFDIIAYDSRAHGQSSGEFCTYGVREREDLRAVIAQAAAPGPVVLVGTSLGAAVALQAAAGEPRVAGVVAAEVFSDLETVARERAPRLLPERIIQNAFQLAERRANFRIDDASPLRYAGQVSAPVLLIHGADDRDTVIGHSHRLFRALPGRRRLVTVAGAGHNQSLTAEVWSEIDAWVEQSIGADPVWSGSLADQRIVRRAAPGN